MMKLFIKKTMLILTVAATLVCSVVSMPQEVSAANDKAQIRSTVKKVMTSIRKSDDKAAYKYITSSDKQQMDSIKKLRKQSAILELQRTNPSYYNYITQNNKKVSYKIQKVLVKGKKATVKIRVKSVDSKAIAQQTTALLTRDMATDEKVAEINALNSLDAIVAYFTAYAETLFQEASASVPAVGTKKTVFTISMKKVKGKWMITDEEKDGFAEISNLMYADLAKAMSEVDTSGVDYSKLDLEKLMAIVMSGAGLSDVDLSKISAQ